MELIDGIDLVQHSLGPLTRGSHRAEQSTGNYSWEDPSQNKSAHTRSIRSSAKPHGELQTHTGLGGSYPHIRQRDTWGDAWGAGGESDTKLGLHERCRWVAEKRVQLAWPWPTMNTNDTGDDRETCLRTNERKHTARARSKTMRVDRIKHVMIQAGLYKRVIMMHVACNMRRA